MRPDLYDMPAVRNWNAGCRAAVQHGPFARKEVARSLLWFRKHRNRALAVQMLDQVVYIGYPPKTPKGA